MTHCHRHADQLVIAALVDSGVLSDVLGVVLYEVT